MHAGQLGNSTAADSQRLEPIAIPPTSAPAAEPLSPPLVPSGPATTLRVLHVINGEHFSGAERVQSHLGRCLPDYSVQADFACVKPGRFAEMLEQRAGKWGRCYNSKMNHRFDLRAAWNVGHLLRDQQYDLLHAHTPRTAMIASIASQWTGVPWVYHVHSPVARDSSRLLINQLNSISERWSLRGCAHVITVSESLRLDCIRRGRDESTISVVHNGVPAIRPARRSTPIPGKRWVLGMVALMRPRKGLEVALEAVAKLKDHYDLMLRIIGPFETAGYEASINDQIASLGIGDRIECVGFTDDVPAELAKLDALLLPSLYGEGLPMVVLEAMAAALPVIATRVEGTPEAITDGVEGLLAEPRNAESLAHKIEELVSGVHDWTQMSESACRRHAKDFSDRAMARKTAAVYHKVVPL